MTKLGVGLIGIALMAVSAGWLVVPPLQAAQDAYNFLSGDWIGHVEEMLAQSALNGGKWHERQASIRRHIHDISYFLHEAGKAAQRADRLAAEHSAKQALDLLNRSVRKGYFRQEDAERILALIKQHLPGVAI